MKHVRSIIIFSSVFLCACLVLSAIGLALWVPGESPEKRLVIILLAALSSLTIVMSVLLIKVMTTFTVKSEQFTKHDSLTGLYNQQAFWEFLGDEIERAKRQDYRFTLMLINLDNFKTINDLYGFKTGDDYLTEFSAIFKQAIRKVDIPSRYSGDNFAAILPVCDESQAYLVGKRILDNLRDHPVRMPDGSASPITASIGMSVFPDNAQTAQDLFLLAENMLHQAKTAGKDRVALPVEAINIDLLKNAGEKSIFIMDAIRQRRVIPFFQPIVNAQDKSVMAYEVLTRIVTPDKIIPAAEFIEAAENMGAIVKIDDMLLEQAFDAVKRSGFTGKLFLNLSPKALVSTDLMKHVRKSLSAYGLKPSQLVFEITERDSLKNIDQIGRHISALQEEGFQFAIDDFGSGYSSFQYMKLFKADFLKVDGDFIRNLTDDHSLEHAIVASISDLAKYMKIQTIAEFVESSDILDIIRSVEINYAQGYHLGKPQPNFGSPSVSPAPDKDDKT